MTISYNELHNYKKKTVKSFFANELSNNLRVLIN